MKYKYTIEFSGSIDICADSEAEAMVYFRNWQKAATGSLYMYGYNCIDCKEIKEEY